jgi:signal transduction histidine kinase
MKKPKIPVNEIERLIALRSYEILDTPLEEIFDSYTTLAASICDVPICLISLVDEHRQWFKSHHGLDATETARDISFCGHAINQKDLFYIEDATKDERFKDNPLVTGNPNVIFYAGQPLIDKNGMGLGSFCVIDRKPRTLSEKQKEQLRLISKQVTYLIEARIFSIKKDETYSLLTKLSDNLPGFIYTYQLFPDGKACFPYSSNAISEHYEVTPDEVREDASVVMTRIHPDDMDDVVRSIGHSASNLTTWTCDYRVNLPTKGERWLRGNSNPEKRSDGSILWHGYIRDITEIKLQESVLAHSAKMATIGEMASGIAHEINNPLAIIQLSSQQIKSTLMRPDFDQLKVKNNLEKIINTTERINKIIKGLKFISQKTGGNEFKAESFGKIIDETLALCSEKFKVNSVELRLRLPENIKNINVDCRSVEISQVLLNLLNNAFDAIINFDKKWVEIVVEETKSKLQVKVFDCGNGIDSVTAHKILEPFYTTKEAGKGTGLGLSITQKIIESHFGKFYIDTKSKNTCFVFEIPKKQIEETKVA